MRKLAVVSMSFLFRVRGSLTLLPDVGSVQPVFSNNVTVFFFRGDTPSSYRRVIENKVQFNYRVRDSLKWTPPAMRVVTAPLDDNLRIIVSSRVVSEHKVHFTYRVRESLKVLGPFEQDDIAGSSLFLKKSDIVDNLESQNPMKVLSARQGYILSEMIGDQNIALTEAMNLIESNLTGAINSLGTTLTDALADAISDAAECCELRRLEIIALREEFENYSSNMEVIDAFDSTETELPLSAYRGKILWDLLSKLVPSSPAGISSITFWNVSGFTAHRIDGGKNIPNIVYVSSIGNKSVVGIYNGESGILTFIAYRDSTEVMRADVDIADAPFSTTNIDLAAAYDPFEGQQGQGGFYKKIDAVFKPGTSFYSFTQGSPNRYQFRIEHTDPAESNQSNIFEIDESPGAPAVASFNITAIEDNKRNLSGIPVYGAGVKVFFNSVSNNLVSNFYNSSWIKSCSGSVLNTRSFTESDFSAITTYGQSLSLTSNITIAGGKFLKGDLIATMQSRNAAGVSASRQASFANVLVDSMTSETDRVKSGSGDFPEITPSGICGSAYDSAQLLSANQELLYLGGKVYYPNESFVDYGGPNYTGLTGRRWFTRVFANKKGTKVEITFAGAVGFGSNPIFPSNIKLFIKCGNETNWISGHDPFSLTNPLSVANSTLDGAHGLLVGESTATKKVITFGRVISTNFTLYVRVGFDQGVTSSFTSFNAVTDM